MPILAQISHIGYLEQFVEFLTIYSRIYSYNLSTLFRTIQNDTKKSAEFYSLHRDVSLEIANNQKDRGGER